MSKQIEIPKNILKPVMERIFVKEVLPPEQVLKNSGIITSVSDFQKGDKAHEIIRKRRYIVIDVDPNSILAKEYALKRGDEVVPFIPEGAIAAGWPKVTDWAIGEDYLVFHETEVGGIISVEELEKRGLYETVEDDVAEKFAHMTDEQGQDPGTYPDDEPDL